MSRTPGTTLRAQNLSKNYGDGPILDRLDFEVPAGETLAVIGPSGCGKSTLLLLLANLEKPSAGTVLHGESPLPVPGAGSGDTAVILQDYGLFPWKTVEDNLTLPLLLRGVPAAERRERGAAMLAELGLAGLERRYPARLSGGQRQRVAIGRALITEPDVLLMDEPFSSLDALTREHLQRVVLDLWRRRRPTCVLVTHSVEEAVFLGGHILVLGGKPARQKLWLENPCFGETGGHEEKRLSLTRQVRAALAPDMADMADADGAAESRPGPERACIGQAASRAGNDAPLRDTEGTEGEAPCAE